MAALTFQDSILDRMLGNESLDLIPGYDPHVDGGPPQGWVINGTQFSVVFMEVYEGRFDDYVTGGPVIALETFWNILPGGEGETEIDWLIGKYSAATDKQAWVISIARLFSMVPIDATVGGPGWGEWRQSGGNGYLSKQHLKDWVNAISV